MNLYNGTNVNNIQRKTYYNIQNGSFGLGIKNDSSFERCWYPWMGSWNSPEKGKQQAACGMIVTKCEEGKYLGFDIKSFEQPVLDVCTGALGRFEQNLTEIILTKEKMNNLILDCKNKIRLLNEKKQELEVVKQKAKDIADVLAAMIKKNADLKPNKHQIAKPAAKIYDLRNLKGKNFRGWYEDMSVGNEESADVAAKIADEAKLAQNAAPSRSYILKKDFMFSDTLAVAHPDSVFTNDVQTLVLNEFQPKEMITPADILGPLLDGIIGMLTKIGGALVATGVKVGGKYVTNTLIDKYSKDTSLLYCSGQARQRAYFTKDPVQMVMNMFGNGGKWLNTYELPYYGNAYLQGKYADKWKAGDASTFLGKGLAGGEGQVGIKMFGIDFPANPKFSITMDPTRPPVTTEFYLINKDTDWLIKNFKFLHAIYAGTSWLHLNYGIIRPPNVYHVLCPGRFQIYWAAMNSEITFEGKLRKNDKASETLAKFNKAIQDQNNYDKDKNNNEIFSSSDMLWPDAWKVKFEIKDLTPDNFNLYADYYMHGFNTDYLQKYEEGVTIKQAVESLGTYIKDMFSKDSKDSFLNQQDEDDKSSWKDQLKEGFGKLVDIGKDLAKRNCYGKNIWR